MGGLEYQFPITITVPTLNIWGPLCSVTYRQSLKFKPLNFQWATN